MSADLNTVVHRLRQNGYGLGPSGESARRADLERLSHALGLAEATIDHLASALGSEVNGPTSLGEPSMPHPDDAAVDRFACAMKLKLASARDNGRAGWNNDEPGMQQRLSDMLRAHVEKGDPRDVANFCMFLHQRGEGISPSTVPASSSASIARPSMQFTLRQAEALLAFFGGANADMTVEYFPANHWPDNPTAPAGLYVYCTEYPDEGALWLGEENNDEAIEPTWQHIPPAAFGTSRVATPDGWKLAMFVLQSDMYHQLPQEERAVCDALVSENPYIAAAPQAGEQVRTVPDDLVLVPRQKIEFAATVLESDGDEYGVGAGLRILLAEAQPEAKS